MMLEEQIPTLAKQFVLPARDDAFDSWVSDTVGILRDEDGASALAERVRRTMAEKLTNAAMAAVFLSAV